MSWLHTRRSRLPNTTSEGMPAARSSSLRSGSSAIDSAVPVTHSGFISDSLACQNSRMTVSSLAISAFTSGQSAIVPPLACSLASPSSMDWCFSSRMSGPQASRVRLRTRSGSATAADRATKPPRQCPMRWAGPPVTWRISSARSLAMSVIE